MFTPRLTKNPPFAITRASHIRLSVRDLDTSLHFYQEVVGLVISDLDKDIAYLRGVEEDSHHSLVLTHHQAQSKCEALGFRVRDEDAFDQACSYFKSQGIAFQPVDLPYQGKTLRLRDPQGIRLELCASMPIKPRLHNKTSLHKGGAGLRFDHTQVQISDLQASYDFFTSLGFMTSDYALSPGGELVSAFLHRKDNPHDLVFGSNIGPRLHHFAYITEKQNLLRAGDTASSIGLGKCVEFGPSRHGQDHASFIYMRDPDGHRVELLSHPIQIIDLDSLPIGRKIADREQFLSWGASPPRPYLMEATEFDDEPLREPLVVRTW